MKKKMILSLVAAAVFSCVPASSLVPVLAAGQKQAQTAAVSSTAVSADEFCSRYAGSRIQTVNSDKTVTEKFVYFNKADENNMSLILEGGRVYATLPESTRKEIDEKLKKEGCDFTSLVKAATALKEQKEAADKEEKPAQSAEAAKPEEPRKEEAAKPAENTGESQQTKPAEEKQPEKEEPAKESGSEKTEPAQNEPVSDEAMAADHTHEDEQQTPAEGSENQTAPAGNVLYSSQLEGEGSLSGQTVTITLTADRQDPSEEGLAQALNDTAKNELGISAPVLYTNVAYLAECGTNTAMRNGLYAAAGENGELHVFQASYDDSGKAWLIDELSGMTYSFDFISQNFHMPIKTSWRYAFEKTPAEQNGPVQNENLQAPTGSEDKKEPAADNQENQTETAQKPDTQKPETSQPAEGEKQSSAAQNFVLAHCSDASGRPYTEATESNYQQILGGFDDWRELSNADKKQVNETLAASGAPAFQTLYRQANQIRLGVPATEEKPAGTPVKTETPATASAGVELVYLSGAALSLFGIFASAFQGRKTKKA